jgi:hypothetical protein
MTATCLMLRERDSREVDCQVAALREERFSAGTSTLGLPGSCGGAPASPPHPVSIATIRQART